MLVQRINWLYPGREAGTKFYEDMKDKYPQSFDEVWVTTLPGFPPLVKHEECAKWFLPFVKQMRKRGVGVSLQLANSIGHGDYMADEYDCSALSDDPKVRKMVGENGEKAKHCYCWRGKAFRKYTRRVVSLYARVVKPDKFWIDDDFRARSHWPVGFGCFCPDCIREFNRRHGTRYTRKTLVKTILSDDLDTRDKWVEFVRDGLASLMREVCEALHKVSPDTEFGYQNCDNGSYDGYGYKYLFDEMKAVNGKAPHFRAGAGYYDDHDLSQMIYKGLRLAYQHSMLPYHGVLSPEIECVPNTAYGKSVAGIMLETSFYLSLGADDITYNAMDDTHDPFSWHEIKFREFEKHRPYWEKLGAASKITKATGIRYFTSERAFDKPLSEGATLNDLNAEKQAECYELFADGIPLKYDRCRGDVILLHPEVAKILSKDEFDALRREKVITCGESVNILKKRGFSLPFSAEPLDKTVAGAVYEKYESFAAQREIKEFYESYYTKGRFCPHALSGETVEVLGRYESRTPYGKEAQGKTATAIYSLGEGGEWAVFGYSLWKPVKTIAERERILDVYDYLTGKAPARILFCGKAGLSIRADADGKTRAVSVLNCTAGVMRDVKVFVKEPYGSETTFWGTNEERQSLSRESADGGSVVAMPEVLPWSVATVFFD